MLELIFFGCGLLVFWVGYTLGRFHSSPKIRDLMRSLLSRQFETYHDLTPLQIRDDFNQEYGALLSLGRVYVLMDQLEREGFLASHFEIMPNGDRVVRIIRRKQQYKKI